MAASISTRPFGLLPTGETVEAWTLTGSGGLVVEAITYGGIVTRLLAPDCNGHLADVVLGFSDLDSYIADTAHFGAITGRVAGRVTSASFALDGIAYSLSPNEPPNHLHGGFQGFGKKLWRADGSFDPDGAPSLQLRYFSPDDEEGYPGNVKIAVTYTVTAENVFRIQTEACTDRPTPFSLTHHSYFNLAGENAHTIEDHELEIAADEYVPTDESMTLLGRLEPVVAGGNDFRVKRTLREAIPQLFKAHGDLYRIRQLSEETSVLAARLEHPGSGRVLEVYTTERCLQLYTGSAFNGSLTGKSKVDYASHAGVCLECHGYPNGTEASELGEIVLRPGVPQRTTTKYAFSCVATSIISKGSSPHCTMRYAPPMPRRKDLRIGILGSGFIVDQCHLVSYGRAGFNAYGIASRRHENAARVAVRRSLARVYGSYDEILADPTIDVLDLAVPPQHQLELIRRACSYGTAKGILAQKPLALSYADAVEAVRYCEGAGIALAVNQNMRYDPSVYGAKNLLTDGFLGAPVFATIDMRGIPHWQPWQAETGSATLKVMSNHHLDCMRFWFGEPERVFCSARPDPRTSFPHTDGICTTILEYESGLQCVIVDDVWTGPAKEGCPGDIRIDWRIEGLDGIAIGDIGWCKDPYTTPSTMRYARKGDAAFRSYAPSESWFPDAFAATMGQLLIAIENGESPAISGRDNLKTIALVEAAMLSAKEHRIVRPQEIIDKYDTGNPL